VAAQATERVAVRKPSRLRATENQEIWGTRTARCGVCV